MRRNGEAVYGSRAWRTPGEGATDDRGRLRTLPGGGGRGRRHADFGFSSQDFRFTEGLSAGTDKRGGESRVALTASLLAANPDAVSRARLRW